jgi:hypothetical protein
MVCVCHQKDWTFVMDVIFLIEKNFFDIMPNRFRLIPPNKLYVKRYFCSPKWVETVKRKFGKSRKSKPDKKRTRHYVSAKKIFFLPIKIMDAGTGVEPIFFSYALIAV